MWTVSEEKGKEAAQVYVESICPSSKQDTSAHVVWNTRGSQDRHRLFVDSNYITKSAEFRI